MGSMMNPMFQKIKGFGKDKGKGKGKDKGKGESRPEYMVWIGNLPKEVGWKELKEHFDQAGTTTWVENFSQKNKGKSKGSGTVAFKTAQEATAAVSMLNGSVLGGAMIQVDEWVKREGGK